MTKKFIASILFISTMLALCIPVSAHSGKTDGDGGHRDSSTGDYHYHHGYPAHDHYDMDGDGDLDCPCDFDDKTGQSSGGDSSSNYPDRNNIYTRPTSAGAATPVSKATKDVNKVPAWVYWIIGFLSFVILCLLVSNKNKKEDIARLEKIRSNDLAEHKEKENKYLREIDKAQTQLDMQEQVYQEKLSNYKDILKDDLDSLNRLFQSVQGEDYLLSLIGAPKGDTIGPNDLPASRDRSNHRWGEKYTFYVASDSRGCKFHSASCAHRGSLPINAYFILDGKNHIPCQLCSPTIPDLRWYYRYKEILAFQKKHLQKKGFGNTPKKEARKCDCIHFLSNHNK